MKATKIKMKTGCGKSNNLLEIDSIYIVETEGEGFYKKEILHDYLVSNPGQIQIDIYPYPNVIPAISQNNEKYVKSTLDNTTLDNLLSLPREES